MLRILDRRSSPSSDRSRPAAFGWSGRWHPEGDLAEP